MVLFAPCALVRDAAECQRAGGSLPACAVFPHDGGTAGGEEDPGEVPPLADLSVRVRVRVGVSDPIWITSFLISFLFSTTKWIYPLATMALVPLMDLKILLGVDQWVILNLDRRLGSPSAVAAMAPPTWWPLRQ